MWGVRRSRGVVVVTPVFAVYVPAVVVVVVVLANKDIKF